MQMVALAAAELTKGQTAESAEHLTEADELRQQYDLLSESYDELIRRLQNGELETHNDLPGQPSAAPANGDSDTNSARRGG